LRKFVFSASRTIKQNHGRGGTAALSILQIGALSAKDEPYSCAFALYLPKMNHIPAPLRFICPNCTSPLPARHWRRVPGWRGIILAIGIGLFIGAVGFQLEPASLITLKAALAQTQTMAIDIFDAIQSWA